MPALLVVLLVSVASPLHAQEAGTIAAAEGRVEIGRDGTWSPAAAGTAVRVGDGLRAGRPGRVQVVFQDDSLLTLGDDTEVLIEEQRFEPSQVTFRALIRLRTGRLRAGVSEYYQQPHAVYSIETATAVTDVHGTEFVVTFDPVAEVTAVVGVNGRVEVHGVLDRLRRGVFVTPRDLTTVARGKFPRSPRQLDETAFRQYLDGLELIGANRGDSFIAAQPILTGASVGEADRVAALAAPPAPVLAAGTVPGTDRFESREADAVDQPPAVLQEIQNGLGDLNVRF